MESDPNCNEKKKYIGNDYATIVYNESGEDYNLNTIKVNFNCFFWFNFIFLIFLHSVNSTTHAL
jgi:Rap/ran-GAP